MDNNELLKLVREQRDELRALRAELHEKFALFENMFKEDAKVNVTFDPIVLRDNENLLSIKNKN